MEKPKSLAIALDVQRRNRSSQPKAMPMPIEDMSDSRPASIADAIISKRKSAMPVEEEEFPELDMEAPEADLSDAPAPETKPFLSRAEAIRAKLKALRE